MDTILCQTECPRSALGLLNEVPGHTLKGYRKGCLFSEEVFIWD